MISDLSSIALQNILAYLVPTETTAKISNTQLIELSSFCCTCKTFRSAGEQVYIIHMVNKLLQDKDQVQRVKELTKESGLALPDVSMSDIGSLISAGALATASVAAGPFTLLTIGGYVVLGIATCSTAAACLHYLDEDDGADDAPEPIILGLIIMVSGTTIAALAVPYLIYEGACSGVRITTATVYSTVNNITQGAKMLLNACTIGSNSSSDAKLEQYLQQLKAYEDTSKEPVRLFERKLRGVQVLEVDSDMTHYVVQALFDINAQNVELIFPGKNYWSSRSVYVTEGRIQLFNSFFKQLTENYMLNTEPIHKFLGLDEEWVVFDV